ncbi:FYVE zinc finger-domain-containing protein [Paraphysoderma sedebokerense]|nr:FYVE zinc finger-domain-containing protein [Paraphysoderma sedebokerense]
MSTSPSSSTETIPTLSCPICLEEFITLGQLNQHLDDAHQLSSLAQDSRDAIQNWLKIAQRKIASWNPGGNGGSGVILGGRERRERNENEGTRERKTSFSSSIKSEKSLSPSERSSSVDKFNSGPTLNSPLTMSKQTDENDRKVVVRRRTAHFLQVRKKMADNLYLEGNKLEKRLEKLAKLHISGADDFQSSGILRTITSSSRRTQEQSVVLWEDDTNILACPICLNQFTFLNRKHHCRLCGRTVCGNILCSTLIPVDLDREDPEIPTVRCCVSCRSAVYKRRWMNVDYSNVPIVVLYNTMTNARLKIMELLPKFNELVWKLSNLDTRTNLQDIKIRKSYHLATSYRKELVSWFSQVDNLAKKIHSLPTSSTQEKRIHQNILMATNNFLQTHMFTLSLLPKLSKDGTLTPNRSSSQDSISSPKPLPSTPSLTPQQTSSPSFLTSLLGISSSPSTPAKSSVIQPNPEKEMYLQTLIEQYTQVEAFINEATQKRRLDDVQSLKVSLDELVKEIVKIEKECYGSSKFFVD